LIGLERTLQDFYLAGLRVKDHCLPERKGISCEFERLIPCSSGNSAVKKTATIVFFPWFWVGVKGNLSFDQSSGSMLRERNFS